MSNPYYIDPDDKEIREELLQLREQLVRILLDADESKLESYFSSDFGIVLGSCPFWDSTIPLSTNGPAEKSDKAKIKSELGGGFGKPGAILPFLCYDSL